jgi:hypothetical protein
MKPHDWQKLEDCMPRLGELKKVSAGNGRRPGTDFKPNEGVQATANSVRSCLAPAVCRA